MAVVPTSIRVSRDAGLFDEDAGGDLTLGDIVYLRHDGLMRADHALVSSSAVVGMVVAGPEGQSFVSGDRITFARSGKVAGFSGLSRGSIQYLGSDGAMTEVKPTTGNVRQVAVALSETEVLLAFGDEPGAGSGGGTGFTLSDAEFAAIVPSAMRNPIMARSSLVRTSLVRSTFMLVKKFDDQTWFATIALYNPADIADVPGRGDKIFTLPASQRPAANTWLNFRRLDAIGSYVHGFVHIDTSGHVRFYDPPDRVNQSMTLAGFTDHVAEGDFLTRPDRPTNVAGTPGSTNIMVTWDLPAYKGGTDDQDATLTAITLRHYRRGQLSRDGIEIELAGDATMYNITGLDTETDYRVQVRADNAGFQGSYTSVETAITTA